MSAGFVSGDIWSALLLSLQSGVFDQFLLSAVRARSNSLSAKAADLQRAKVKMRTMVGIKKSIPIQIAFILLSFHIPNSAL